MRIEFFLNGVWQEEKKAIQPINWSYKLNEEFDTGFFTILYSPRKKPYPMFTKMRIVDGAEITNWYCSSQVKKANSFEELYHHTVAFVEPTIILQYLTMSGETFTQPTTGAKKTMADYFNRLLEITPLRLDGELQRFSLVADDRLNVEAREFTTLNNNLLEAFIDGARYIHAFPRMKDYDTITFDFFGNLTEIIQQQNYVLQNSGMNPNNYCADIEIQAENVIGQKSIVYPAPNAGVTVRGTGIDLTSENAYIQLPMPIERLVTVKMWGFEFKDNDIIETFTAENPFYLYQTGADFQYIVEKEIWESLPSNVPVADYSQIAKCEKMYYTKYGNKIENIAQSVGKFLLMANNQTWRGVVRRYILNKYGAVSGFPIEGTYDELQFNIEYIPAFSARTRQITLDKRETEATLIDNQSQNIVDFDALGKNLVGKVARIGNDFVKETYNYPNLSSLPKMGGVKKIGGENYILETQDIEWYNEYTKTTNTYTKDFSRISDFVGLNQQRRSFELSTAIVRDRKLYRKEYVVFDTVMPTSKQTSVTNWGKLALIDCVIGLGTAGQFSLTSLCNNSYVATKGNSGATIVNLLLPTFCAVTGKSLQFDFAFMNNLSAGKENVENSGLEKDSSLDIPYTSNGEVEKMNISIGANASNVTNYNANSLPKIQGYMGGGAIDLSLIVKKDTAERLLFSQQLHYVDNSGKISIGNGFLEENALITDRSLFPQIKVYGFNYQVNRLNPSLENGAQIVAEYSVIKNSNYYSITITGNGNYEAIGLTANNKLLFALNEKISGNFSKTVYIYFTRER